MSSSAVSQWPPTITDQQREELTLRATTFALSHGLIYLPVADVQPPAPTSAIHAPLALFPSPFPRKEFEFAKQLQHAYNAVYAHVALDEDFLDRVMGAEVGVGRVDEFTGQLWKIWKRLRDEGIQQVRVSNMYANMKLRHARQRLHLGLFRSDYLLHAPKKDGPVSLKQVEFNTISSSFGTLSENIAKLHKYIVFFPEAASENNGIPGI